MEELPLSSMKELALSFPESSMEELSPSSDSSMEELEEEIRHMEEEEKGKNGRSNLDLDLSQLASKMVGEIVEQETEETGFTDDSTEEILQRYKGALLQDNEQALSLIEPEAVAEDVSDEMEDVVELLNVTENPPLGQYTDGTNTGDFDNAIKMSESAYNLGDLDAFTQRIENLNKKNKNQVEKESDKFYAIIDDVVHQNTLEKEPKERKPKHLLKDITDKILKKEINEREEDSVKRKDGSKGRGREEKRSKYKRFSDSDDEEEILSQLGMKELEMEENNKLKQKSPVKLFPEEKNHKHKEDSKSKDRSETRLRSRSRSQDSEEGDPQGKKKVEKKEQVEDVKKKISVPGVTKGRDRRSRSQDSQGDKSLLDDSTVEEENLPDTQELSPEQRKRHLERARENLRKIKKMPITSRIVMHGRNNVSLC